MESNAPGVNLADSVQVGHNAIGPTTGDIVINSGNQIERCSMCKTPIDAKTNPGLYCFKEECDTLFCKNCESFFRAEREPGEKPYCSEHIAEFVGAPIPKVPPGLNQPQPRVAASTDDPSLVSANPAGCWLHQSGCCSTRSSPPTVWQGCPICYTANACSRVQSVPQLADGRPHHCFTSYDQEVERRGEVPA